MHAWRVCVVDAAQVHVLVMGVYVARNVEVSCLSISWQLVALSQLIARRDKRIVPKSSYVAASTRSNVTSMYAVRKTKCVKNAIGSWTSGHQGQGIRDRGTRAIRLGNRKGPRNVSKQSTADQCT